MASEIYAIWQFFLKKIRNRKYLESELGPGGFCHHCGHGFDHHPDSCRHCGHGCGRRPDFCLDPGFGLALVCFGPINNFI
jgi:hypothetical protein